MFIVKITKTTFLSRLLISRQQGGKYYIFFSAKTNGWVNTIFHVGNTNAGLWKKESTYCADNIHGWHYYNGSDLVLSKDIVTSCATVEQTCCSSVTISSVSSTSNTSNLYDNRTRDALGLYSAVGMSNGRYLYQSPGKDKYLEYNSKNQDWLVTGMVGSTWGYIYHNGGSVCVEDASNKWKVGVLGREGWASDTNLIVECTEREEKQEGGGHNEIEALYEITGYVDSGRPTIIGLSFLSLVLFAVILTILGRRFYRAWRKGAHGKNLFLKSIDL